jgi:hypothetical protein
VVFGDFTPYLTTRRPNPRFCLGQEWDDHHNGLAQKEGYKFLLVFGAKYEKRMDVELGEIEFKSFESTDFGFVAAKTRVAALE